MTLAEGWPDFTPRSTPQADYDLIGTVNAVLNPGTFWNAPPSLGTYQGLLVVAFDTSAVARLITVGLDSGSLGSYVVQLQGYSNVSTPWQAFLFPYPCKVGDVVHLVLSASVGSANTYDVQLYGLRYLPTGLRYDLRPFPIGLQTLYSTLGNAGILVPAPVAPGRILLKSATISVTTGGAGGGFAAITPVISGNTNGVITVADLTGVTASREWAGGLLCDPGQPIVIGATAGVTVVCDACYDVVL